jgi:hypothetical protein
MRRVSTGFLFVPLFALISTVAVAQAGSFQIAQNGKPVGTADYSFKSSPNGYDSASVVRVAMPGLDYLLSKTEELSSANEIQHVQLSAVVNSEAVNVIGKPDSAQFLLNTSANGHSATTRLDSHSSAVFLPDFDPGALETLLALAVNHNNRDLWVIIPKQTGPNQAGTVEPVRLITHADLEGTLDGKPITVHHLVAEISGASTHLFSGPDNQLLQAELPQSGFALVRKGFVLTPPAKPGAPPEQPQTQPAAPATAPPSQPGTPATPLAPPPAPAQQN